MSTEYFLEFPYGTRGGVYLTHEFKLDALASHYDYRGKLYQEQMSQGYRTLFAEIQHFKLMSFYKLYNYLDHINIFSTAFGDKRTIPYAFIYAKDGKNILDIVVFNNFRVTQFRYLSFPDEDKTPLGVWIMLMMQEKNKMANNENDLL